MNSANPDHNPYVGAIDRPITAGQFNSLDSQASRAFEYTHTYGPTSNVVAFLVEKAAADLGYVAGPEGGPDDSEGVTIVFRMPESAVAAVAQAAETYRNSL